MRIFSALFLLALATPARADVSIAADAKLPTPAALALKDLERAVEGRKANLEIVVGIAGQSKAVDALLASEKIALPESPESLAVKRVGAMKLLIAGRDARGLAFALRDTARAISSSATADGWLAVVHNTIESPYLASRTVSVHLFNEHLEAKWYFDEAYWNVYFTMLSRERFNNLTLTFCDQTNYLCPLYSHLLDVPGFPGVRVKGVTPQSQAKQLAMLKRIAELADDHGLDFTLGIWQQVPVPAYPPKVEVEGLPEGVNGAAYCAAGLKALLQACPAIDGVQLRMNAEAGVAEDQQTNYYRPIFHAIRDCGRKVKVELRYKGLKPETTQAALDAGLAVNVSTKFWSEHFGLPYHQTVVDSHYRKDRYGFGNVLAHDRKYGVIFQHWTAGSQRITVWGDPDYAAKFARACKAAGGDGYEVFAPLTNRGYGNGPAWDLYPNAKLTPIQEQERYWFFYLSFGRLGYDPATPSLVWTREFRQRYGVIDGTRMSMAYKTASKILPLIMATQMPSASEWSWWPELDTGDRLGEYARAQPGDTAQFYAIRTWERTPKWRAEAWDADVSGYVEDALAGTVRGKWTPWDIARELERLWMETITGASSSTLRLRDDSTRITIADFEMLAYLARYHAAKLRAATHLALFEATGDQARLTFAHSHMIQAEDSWKSLSRIAMLQYSPLVFGTSPANARNKFGHHHSGHWSDRAAEIQTEREELEVLLPKIRPNVPKARYVGEERPAEALDVQHKPVDVPMAGQPLAMEALVTADGAKIDRVILHHRPMDQTVPWSSVDMTTRDGKFSAAIPGSAISPRFDLQYYFEVLYKGGGGRMWPNWQDGMPYVIVRTK